MPLCHGGNNCVEGSIADALYQPRMCASVLTAMMIVGVFLIGSAKCLDGRDSHASPGTYASNDKPANFGSRHAVRRVRVSVLYSARTRGAHVTRDVRHDNTYNNTRVGGATKKKKKKKRIAQEELVLFLFSRRARRSRRSSRTYFRSDKTWRQLLECSEIIRIVVLINRTGT